MILNTKKILFRLVKQKKYNGLFFGLIILFCSQINASILYVNDTSKNGDIYTTSIGNDSNDGRSPDRPKLSVLSAYNMANENDTIVVDIGNYNEISVKGELLFENTKKVKFLIAGFSDKIYSKTPLPTNEKVSPTVFYIKNDKPIDRESYMRSLINRLDKN